MVGTMKQLYLIIISISFYGCNTNTNSSDAGKQSIGLCPKQLYSCYSNFEKGSECEAENIYVSFSPIPVDESNTDELLKGCVFYYNHVSTLQYCCNGYISCRGLSDFKPPNLYCSSKYLEKEYEININTSGIYNQGIILGDKIKELPSSNFICIRSHNSKNETYKYHVGAGPDIYVSYYNSSIKSINGDTVLFCPYDEEPYKIDVKINDLNINEDIWIADMGNSCDDFDYHLSK